MRSINNGFIKEEMSVTQRRGVNTCTPKDDKPKKDLKNWRPITLLDAVDNIASACIEQEAENSHRLRIRTKQPS